MLQSSHHRNSSNAADSSNHAVEKEKDTTQSQEYEMEVLEGQAIKDQLAQLHSVSTDGEDYGPPKTVDPITQDLTKKLEEMRLQLASTKAELERERQQHSQNSNSTNNTEDSGALAEEIALLKRQCEDLKTNADRDAAEFEEVIDVQEKELEALKADHLSTVDALAQEKKALEEKVLELTEAASVATTTREKETDKPGVEQEQEHQLVVQQLQAEVKALRESHANEMDEILVQLDEVEAEHAQQLLRVKEEVAVAAAQEQHDTDNQVMAATAQVLREQLQDAQRRVRECQESYAARQREYEESLEEERRAAADEARQEMINQAESQFEQANDMYVQLKEEFAASLDTTAELQGELDEAYRALEAAHTDASRQQELFQQQLDQLQQGE